MRVRRGRRDLTLGRQGRSCRIILPRINTPAGSVLILTRPGDDEIPTLVHRDVRNLLKVRRCVRDGNGTALCDTGTVETLGLDIRITTALPVPGHDEIATIVHSNRGMLIVITGDGIHQKFCPLRHPGRIVPLPIDAIDTAPCCAFTCPHHDIVARRIHGDINIILVTGCGGIHQHVRSDFRTGGVVALGIDIVVIGPGFVIAFPGHDERAISGHRDVRMLLVVDGRLVHQKLTRDCCA